MKSSLCLTLAPRGCGAMCAPLASAPKRQTMWCRTVFLSLFRHLQLGRPRTNLKGWLFQVAHNLALKERHRMQRRQRTEGDWDGNAADRLINPAAGPEEQLAREDRSRHLRAVLLAVAGTQSPLPPLARGRPRLSRHCPRARRVARSRREIGDACSGSFDGCGQRITPCSTALT